MELATRPFLVLYVAWHPRFKGGRAVARAMYDHYRRKLYENVAGGTGLGVVYRSAPEPGSGVPVVRMDPKKAADRIDHVVSRLLDEVLKDFLWRCRVQLASGAVSDDTVFLPRPPELISLAGLREKVKAEATLVYPDPPIGAEEQRLFEVVAPTVRLRSMTEWLSESTV